MRLVALAILLATLTSGLVGAASYVRARRALERAARTRLALLAHHVAERVHRDLDDAAADITNATQVELMRAVLYRDVDKQIARFLAHEVAVRGRFAAMACVAADGDVVASVGDIDADAPLPASPPPARTRLVVVRGGEGAPARRRLRFDAPILHPDDPARTVGTLVAWLAPPTLRETLATSRRSTHVLPALAIRTASGDVVLDTPADVSGRGPGDDGRVLSATVAVEPLANAAAPAFVVVVAEPASVALAAVTELRDTLLVVGLLLLLASSAVGALVAWRISVPITRLTDVVRGIATSGQVEADVPFPRAGGEVGLLAAAFGRMLERLRAAQAESLVQARRAFLGEVAANVAHEVRTPLAVLKTSAQLLGRDDVPLDEQRRLAANIAAEVDRLNAVVTSLVDLARPRPARRRPESLAAIVEKAVAFFRPQAMHRGVRLDVATEDGDLRMRADADALHQVLLNVIHNALQAMDGAGTLRIRSRRDGAWALVEVTDSGPGFAPAVLARPFAPFVTTRPDGAGLGLAISRRIVEEHGGTIALERPRAGGARVRIRLPLVAGEA